MPFEIDRSLQAMLRFCLYWYVQCFYQGCGSGWKSASVALLLKIEKYRICSVVEREEEWKGSKQYYNVDSGDIFLFITSSCFEISHLKWMGNRVKFSRLVSSSHFFLSFYPNKQIFANYNSKIMHETHLSPQSLRALKSGWKNIFVLHHRRKKHQLSD